MRTKRSVEQIPIVKEKLVHIKGSRNYLNTCLKSNYLKRGLHSLLIFYCESYT